MSDSLRRFLLQGAPVRGEIVSLDDAWLEVVNRHELPDSVRDRLGELSAAALLLAATLKFDGSLVLQIHGDGPVALFVVECDADGDYRATVKLREEAPTPADDASLRELVDVEGKGRFVVTLVPGSPAPGRQPYQGIVPFEGNSVSMVLEHYMARSEQLPTRMWLAADGRRAVGLLLQRMPSTGGTATVAPPAAETPIDDDDAWNRMQQLADTITRGELLRLAPEHVIRRLFWQEPLHAFDERQCRFACTCTRDKVASMLRMLGEEEVEGIVAERGAVEVRCEFCNLPYLFDRVDCAELFVPGVSGPGPSLLQ
ncbi:Hsp33 family molecular chaperone HslO [Quisquiliibacterium transsilvanicum]|jgi:molecular chaperone Hsp33|uniref:Molecular chaperone Hsp33 n=1 Tax=Quisquiliibacterium transsilvanicum TaxID=1549638 RepID=A0A7W8HLR8_9BURK|nr:Hsp33 family molecular chaperone HslO [Quisquiliibacterium transsilvanicum]MBB5273711.1 molecular chaperone Hsp33 [Quisquiliibacterium transsilvanicum]